MLDPQPIIEKSDEAIVVAFSRNSHDDQLLAVFWRVLVGGLGGFVLASLLGQMAFHTIPRNFPVTTIVGTILGVAIMLRVPRHWHTILISRDGLSIRRGRERIDLLPDKVETIMAIRGLNARGGDIFPWKYIVVSAEGKRFLIHLHARDLPTVFESLMRICHNAIGVTDKLQVILPASADANALTHWIGQRHTQIRQEFNRLVLSSLAMGLVLFLVSAAMGILLVLSHPEPERAGHNHVIIYAIIFAAGSAFYWMQAIRASRAKSRVLRQFAQALTMSTSPTAEQSDFVIVEGDPPPGSVGKGTRLLAILGLLLFWCPILGLAVAGMSYARYRREPGSPLRAVSRTGFILSLCVTVTVVMSVIVVCSLNHS